MYILIKVVEVNLIKTFLRIDNYEMKTYRSNSGKTYISSNDFDSPYILFYRQAV